LRRYYPNAPGSPHVGAIIDVYSDRHYRAASHFYADFGGGRQHQITTDEIVLRISGKWIDATCPYNAARPGGLQVVTEMRPVLDRVAHNTVTSGAEIS
jgi:hypothetical protein